MPSPVELLSIDPGMLREVGLSWRKVSTLRDLAERLTDGRLNPNGLSGHSDDELMAELTAIPGIGPWTVQGALIIAFQREDVVLPGDLAYAGPSRRAEIDVEERDLRYVIRLLVPDSYHDPQAGGAGTELASCKSRFNAHLPAGEAASAGLTHTIDTRVAEVV